MEDHCGVKGELGDLILMDVFRTVDGLCEGNEVVINFGIGRSVSVDQKTMVGQNDDGELVVV